MAGIIIAVALVAAFASITESSSITPNISQQNAVADSEGTHFFLELNEDVNVVGTP